MNNGEVYENDFSMPKISGVWFGLSGERPIFSAQHLNVLLRRMQPVTKLPVLGL